MRFIAETAVKEFDRGREVRFENIYKGTVGAGAQRVVVELCGDPPPDLLGRASVAAARALHAQLERGQHGHRAVDMPLEARLEEDRALQHHVIARLARRPCLEVGDDRRVDKSVQGRKRRRIPENTSGEVFPVEGAVAAVGFRAETIRDAGAQSGVLLHQPPGLRVAVVHRNAPRGEKSAHRALAAADAPRDTDLHHGSSGVSISGISPRDTILISLKRVDSAFCSDWGSMTDFPSCPSSAERCVLISSSGMRSRLFM